MSRNRTQDGRYAHEWNHAGFDRDGYEWAVCSHCLRYKRPDGKLVTRSFSWAEANLLPNHQWPRDTNATA